VSPRQQPPFGAQLRRLREAAGLTQEELALHAGLTPNAVGDLERGKTRRPYPHTVRSLADALGLSEEQRATLLSAVPRRGRTDAVVPPTAISEANLPNPPTPLLGREREIAEIRQLLLGGSEARLLTLTGIGGVGKTRLAIASARDIEGGFGDGAVFVGLASVKDPALVVPTVAASLGLRETDGRGPRESLHAYLRAKRLLLVMDNFEHVVSEAAEVAGLIEACPEIVVLATSRAPLLIRGEQVYPVQPLALPLSTQDPTEEEVLGTPSGRLFAESARAAYPSFAITQLNAPAVAAICWRLSGIPLAIEIAAAKVRFLEPAVLLDRLDQALSTAWARDLPERQRTMRAALDWSYGLLSEPERGMFGRLSVFAGGFALEAAEAIAAGERREEVLGLLGALAEQSLVVVVRSPEEGDEARYGMLEPVRQYALEKLEESGQAEEARRLHADYFLDLAEGLAPGLRGADELEWLARLDKEYDNFRVAFSWALGATGDARTAARLGWTLQTFFWVRGYHREGRRWAEATLERELPEDLRARALHLAAMTAYIQGDYPAAGERWTEALRLSRRAHDPLVEAYARAGTGIVELTRSDHESAVSSQEEAIALFERCGDEYMATTSRGWLGLALLARGEDERARKVLEVAVERARLTKNPALIQTALYNLAQSALARGDQAGAERMLEEAAGLSKHVGDRITLAQYLEALSVVASSRAEAERAAVLIGAAEGLLEEVGAPGYGFQDPAPSLRERRTAEARSVLGDVAFEKARDRGKAMTFEQAVEYAVERGG
jgi:predicted ATPase/DNA-binding XRE family transcriptional regulator